MAKSETTSKSKSVFTYVSAIAVFSVLATYGYYQSTQNSEKSSTTVTVTIPAAETIKTSNIQNNQLIPQPTITQTQQTQQTAEPTIVEQEAKESQQDAIDEREIAADTQFLASIDNDIAATKPPMLWEALDDNEDLSQVKISDEIQGAQKIKMNTELLKNVVPGDQIQLPVLDGSEYTIDIEKVNDDKKNVNIRGRVEAQGESYLATITQGEKRTFATISTPNGTYDLRLVNGKGWVYESDQLNAHIDTTKPDVLLPPDNLLNPTTAIAQ